MTKHQQWAYRAFGTTMIFLAGAFLGTCISHTAPLSSSVIAIVILGLFGVLLAMEFSGISESPIPIRKLTKMDDDRELRLRLDDVAHKCLKNVRGCVTDEQYMEVLGRVTEALVVEARVAVSKGSQNGDQE